MILTCPQCATRYQTDAAAFPPAGRKVRCAKCGHVWHQEGAPREAEAEPEIEIIPPAPPPGPNAALRASAFAPAAVTTSAIAEPTKTKTPGLERYATAGGWLTLALVIFVIGWAAVTFRQNVATLWPQSASLYATLGLDVNARGIAFDGVAYRHETEDNQSVLAVTGRIVNISSRELPVPSVRVTLTGGDARELYHWNFKPDVATLAPGKSENFTTRLSSPPAAARHLELHFSDSGG